MYRYWDGTNWTTHLTATPPGAGPGGPNGGNRRALVIASIAGVLVLVLVAAFSWPRIFPTAPGPSPVTTPAGSEAPDPTVSAWDETTTPTPPTPTPTTPTPTPTRPTPSTPRPSPSAEPSDITGLPCPRVEDPVVNGRLYGGKLSTVAIPAWEPETVRLVDWAACASGVRKQIAPTWVSEVILGGVLPAAMTPDLQSQAEVIAEDASVRFYEEVDSWKILTSKGTTMLGRPAWRITMEVRISDLGPDIPGDKVEIIVIETSPGSRSALLTFATIGDTKTQSQVNAMRDTVRLEP
jgi:hypothetical protein